jgi:hypothetical protein
MPDGSYCCEGVKRKKCAYASVGVAAIYIANSIIKLNIFKFIDNLL